MHQNWREIAVAPSGRRKQLMAGDRVRRLWLQELESRLAPSISLVYDWSVDHSYNSSAGAHLTLKVADQNAASWLQIVDNDTSTVVHEVQLTDDALVTIKGGQYSDTLAIDFSYSGSAVSHAINVTFLSDTTATPEAGTVSNQVTISGAGNLYKPSSFTLTSDAPVSIPGALTTANNGDIIINDQAATSGGLVSTGLLANVSTSITLAGGSLTGRNVTLDAASTVTVNSQSLALFGGLVQVGVLTSDSTASVAITSGMITASGNLTLRATSNVTTNLAAAPSSNSNNTATDAAVSNSTVTSSPSVTVSGGTLIASSGTLSLTATNTTNVTTTAMGNAGGSAPSAKGGTVGVAEMLGDTDAIVTGGSVTGGTVNISATSNRTVSTSASATQGGATNPGAPNTTQGQQALSNNNAATSDGKVNFAGAVAVTTLLGDTKAEIEGGSLTSTAPLALQSSATSALTTTADGSPASGLGGTGIGAAVGIGVTNINSLASIGGNSSLTAGVVNVTSLLPASNFVVNSTSGRSGAGVGVAGALSIDSTSANTTSKVDGAANFDNANLALSATSTTGSTATAMSQTIGSQAVGVGASAAINYANTGSRASIEDNAVPTNVGSLSLTAQGTPTMTTTAAAGAAGGTATGAAVALSIPTGATSAVIGVGPTLTLGGAMMSNATRTSSVTTEADGVTGASGVGVGAVVGLTFANESTQATVGRSITAPLASLTANATGNSSTTGLASAQGAAPGSTAAAALISNWLAFGVSRAWTNTLALPNLATPDGSLGVAGAIAVNFASPTATSSVLVGSTFTLTGSLIDQALTQYNASAAADGTAVNTITGIAGAVSLDNPTPDASAAIAGSATASSVTLTATITNGESLSAAKSGAGSTSVGVAGALSLNFPGATTSATIATGGSVTIPGSSSSDLLVKASTTSTDTATADSTAAGLTHLGVGASAVFQYSTNGATASTNGAVTVPHNATFEADGIYTTVTTATAGAVGGTGVAPALALAVTNNATQALIQSAAMLSIGGALLVRAYQRTNSTTRGRGDSAGPNVALGTVLSGDIALDTATASVAGNVTKSASATIEVDHSGSSTSWSTAGSRGATLGTLSLQSLVGDTVSFGQNAGWIPNSVMVPAAKTADGNMTLAAAAAVNVDLTSGTATIVSGGTVTTSSPLVVQTISLENASSLADGTSADNAVTGVGASLAINVPRPSFQATIAGAATAPAITVQTLMQTGTTNTFSATAWSGAGATNTGVAGALSINIPGAQSYAGVSNGANLTISGSVLTVNAAQSTANDSFALAKTSPSRTALGIGASVAVNTARNSTQAEIGAAAITGAASILDIATGTHLVTTTANAGASISSAAAAAAAAVGYSGNSTEADLLAGSGSLSFSGGVTIHAIHNGTITTTADGKSVATGAGVGMAIGVGINLDSSTARDSRALNIGGVLLVEADSNTPTTTSGSASAAGGKTIGQAIDTYIAQQIGLVDPNAGTGNAVNVPGIGSSLTSIQNTVGLALPVIGLGAAISANIAQPKTTAEIASNITISANNVSVLTSVDGADTSTADGIAANNLASAGLGLAANLAGGTSKAAIDDNDIVTAPTISVTAGVANPHLFTVSAAAGAVGVAGAPPAPSRSTSARTLPKRRSGTVRT